MNLVPQNCLNFHFVYLFSRFVAKSCQNCGTFSKKIFRKLGLSQRNSEFFTLFLKNRKLTQLNVSPMANHKRQTQFQHLCTVKDTKYVHLLKCNERSFIDGSVSSSKVELLHKTNAKKDRQFHYHWVQI